MNLAKVEILLNDTGKPEVTITGHFSPEYVQKCVYYLRQAYIRYQQNRTLEVMKRRAEQTTKANDNTEILNKVNEEPENVTV